MKFTQAAAAAILAFCASGVLAAPLPQLAGEGSAANSILSDTDNASGYSVEEIEDNTACTISSGKVCTGATAGGGSSSAPPPPPPHKRQLAGEGSAADSILSDTDNSVGYSVEDVEDNTANTISSGKVSTGASNGSGGSSSGAAPPPPPPHRRQLDKISAGAGKIGDAAGVGSVTDPVAAAGESADGELTSAAANAGAEVGSAEESTLESTASQIPKRQLDKISAGAGKIGDAVGAGAVADPVASEGEQVDGELTSAAANAGAEVGSSEESTLEGTASQVPKL